ncbi:MAG: hypothetical protein USCAAHI_00396 [Beijerinckiaceae bacterium]|nr:MAG: hypothetical protein USCAAHI_00396 [Beijerinckiaceae bacterium]
MIAAARVRRTRHYRRVNREETGGDRKQAIPVQDPLRHNDQATFRMRLPAGIIGLIDHTAILATMARQETCETDCSAARAHHLS